MSRDFSLASAPDDLFAQIPVGAPGGPRAGLSLALAGDMSFSLRAELPWRSRFLQSIGANPRSTFALRQIHSRTVLVIDSHMPEDLVAFEADGMVSARPDAILTVTVADCIPVFLVDSAHRAYGIVHSGWKGTGIVREALRLMSAAFGTQAADVAAALGPGIGPCCYRVPRERYERFRADFGSRAVVRGGASDDYRLDLRQANVDLLMEAGVRDISVCADCTSCSKLLGSFRRQGPQGFTRMLAFIGHLPEAPA